MATHPPVSSSSAQERLHLGEKAGTLYHAAQVLAVVGLVSAILLGWKQGDDFRLFFHAYLVGFLFFLAIALGGLFFVMLQHATKAGWSVNVRRIAEWFASTLPIMAALSAPLVVTIVVGKGHLYPWATSTWHGVGFKAMWLSPAFFIIRLAIYFIVWSFLGVWYWRQSLKQDVTGDLALTAKMQHRAPVGLILFGLCLTFAAWDWIMSLDPNWYSTIFGVYYFAGCALAVFSSITLTVLFLQSQGLLKQSVTIEHFHDLGKFMFGFTFFWGYIAFSQYMLQWYGNLPAETGWYLHHGASTHAPNAWSKIAILLLFGHLLIPFPGLLSRHVKRNPKVLGFWAVWILVFCWVDLYWLVMPEYDVNIGPRVGLIDIAVLLGIGGIFVSMVIRRASLDAVRPMRDPRLAASLAFENQ